MVYTAIFFMEKHTESIPLKTMKMQADLWISRWVRAQLLRLKAIPTRAQPAVLRGPPSIVGSPVGSPGIHPQPRTGSLGEPIKMVMTWGYGMGPWGIGLPWFTHQNDHFNGQIIDWVPLGSTQAPENIQKGQCKNDAENLRWSKFGLIRHQVTSHVAALVI